jgi:hypothetical protein
MKDNQWARLLAYVTGLGNQALLLENEYLAAENRILHAHLPARLRRSDPELCTVAEIGQSPGESGLCRQTRHHPGLVLAAHRPQVRWLPMRYISWPTPDFSGGGGTGGSLRPRELGVGLRPHRGRAGQPGHQISDQTVANSAATTSHQLPSGVKGRLGRSSSAGTWTCSPEPISSRSKC